MEQDSQVIAYFTDPLLLSYITTYLTINEKLLLTSLSKKIRFMMEDYFRMLLNQNKLHMIPNKSSIHQMRFYFDRCLRIFRTNKQGDSKSHKDEEEGKADKRKSEVRSDEVGQQEQLKLTIQTPFKFNVITFFEVGMVYTCYLDNQHRSFIFRTNQILSLIQSQKKPTFIIQPGVKEVKCKGEKLFILKLNGEVLTWQADKKSQDICQKDTHLYWTHHIPVKTIHISFNYAVFLLENPHQSKQILLKHLFNYSYKISMDFEQVQDSKYYFIALNIQTSACFIVSVKAHALVSVAVGHKQAYLVNEHHECYVVQFQQINEGVKQLSAKRFAPLAEKHIMKIFGNYNYFLALERNVEVIEEWTNEEVLVWMRNIGFADFAKIAKAQRIDGRKLKNIERRYMENVLGINKLNMQQKFMLCIEEVVEGKNESDQIWVWGKNDFGQLGVSHANYVGQPYRIKMDFLKGNDRIDTVFCGWYQTFIRTHRGKIYHSTITTERKKKKTVEEKEVRFSDEEEEKREVEEPFKYKNKKRKKTEDFQVGILEGRRLKNHKKFQQDVKWVQSTAGKAFFVECFKDYVFYIQCPDQSKFQPTKQKKLRTSKAIIDRILWDDSLDKSQFKIGLIDKDMGTIEVTLYQIQAFDYKETSIRYVKKNTTIVWDRQSKIDYL